METVTDLAAQEKLHFRRGTFNILDCGIRTGKTYWAVKNLQQFSRDGKLNRILYLVDTTALKDSILKEYGDICMDGDMLWLPGSSWNPETNKIGVMCYQSLGMKYIKNAVSFINEIDCICWDECDSIFGFAASAFARARREDFNRPDISAQQILAIIMQFSSKTEYMPLIFLDFWEKLIQENRVMCIGLSGTPARSQQYYESLFTSVYEGKLSASLRLGEAVLFHDIFKLIQTLDFDSGTAYWCYSNSLSTNIKLSEACRNVPGCHPIELHSLSNTKYPMTEEQRKVAAYYNENGMIPPEYNFVIVTAAFGRGQNLYDARFQWTIINTLNEEMRIQADRQVFPHRCYLKAFTYEVPEEYKNRWVPVSECRELAELMGATDYTNKRGQKMSWNKLAKVLPDYGYEIRQQKKWIDGKAQQCYFITGTLTSGGEPDKDFLALAEAHAALEEIEVELE